MEEKERYYSLIDNNGNFELRDYESNKDIHSLYELDDLLNQQDKRIKELERIGDKGHLNDLLEDRRKENRILMKIVEQLEQLQKELAINELNDILKFIVTGSSNYYKPPFEIKKHIEDKIKELKGEE